MKLLEIGIHNYKSLRSVTFVPGPLSVLVGPNAAGKSNFCDALDFIGEMYRWGLELAVARHGGYENICYRHSRRSKSPIRFRARFEFESGETRRALFRGNAVGNLVLEHEIEFGTPSQKIEAPFRIARESVNLALGPSQESETAQLVRLTRSGEKVTTDADVKTLRRVAGRQLGFFDDDELVNPRSLPPLAATQSMLGALDRLLFPFFWLPPRSLGSLRVFQLGPAQCRQAGVPTPNPELERSGTNLPAVIQFIKASRTEQYLALLATLRRVMPSLEDLNVAVTPQKTLGLWFQEKGFGSPWTTEDVSDGTIRVLGLLATVFDPDLSLVAVEEPENSLHPWAIRQFVDACRVAAQDKQIILTTHSPVLINHLKPEEVWIVQRPPEEAATKIDPLLNLDPTARSKWEKGDYTLAEYLDSGAIPEAVPAAPI